MRHQTAWEEGDHHDCPVELLACPEHQDQQLREMGYEPGTDNMPKPAPSGENALFHDERGNRTLGFCVWCARDFYTMDEVEAHNADNMANCPEFQRLKDEGWGPPVLNEMFRRAGLLDDVQPEAESPKRSDSEEEK